MNLPPAHLCAAVLRRRPPHLRMETPERVTAPAPKPMSLHLEVLREFAEAQHRHHR